MKLPSLKKSNDPSATSKASTSKTPKLKRTTPLKPMGAWRLWRASLIEFRHGMLRYALIVGIVTVPIYLLSLLPGVTTSSAIGGYVEIAFFVMNVALIWAIVQREKTGKVPGIRAAYYEGTGALISFTVVSFFVILMVIPAIIAGFLYLVGLVAADSGGTTYEEVVITLTCTLIASVSVWLLVRFGMAPMITVTENLRPFAALRLSRRLTLGRFWRVLARYLGLVLGIVAIGVPIALLGAGLALLKLNTLSTLIAQFATTLSALPLANIYFLRLYRNLELGPAMDNVPEPADTAEITPNAEPALVE